jgi:S-DNA-T family DNA segregation ATPase FtsK/SpoIIIE
LLEIWRSQAPADGSRIDPDHRQVPVGIGGDEALPLCLDLDAAPVTLVAGPVGSGRTSALRCIADGLGRLGEPVLWVSLTGRADNSVRLLAEREPFANNVRPADLTLDRVLDPSRGLISDLGLADLPSFHGFQIIDGSSPGAAAMLGGVLATWPTSTVLVDDIQPGVPGSAQDALEDLLIARVGTNPLVIASSTAELLGAYRGVLAAARTTRSGILLGSAGPGEAEAFGLRSDRRPPGPPGRALLIQDGRPVSVQLSLPPCLQEAPSRPDACPGGADGEVGTPGSSGDAVVAGHRRSPPRGDPTATGRSGEMVDT